MYISLAQRIQCEMYTDGEVLDGDVVGLVPSFLEAQKLLARLNAEAMTAAVDGADLKTVRTNIGRLAALHVVVTVIDVINVTSKRVATYYTTS